MAYSDPVGNTPASMANRVSSATVRISQFAHQAFPMRLDRSVADTQLRCDLLIGMTADNPQEHLPFARGELIQGQWCVYPCSPRTAAERRLATGGLKYDSPRHTARIGITELGYRRCLSAK